MGTYVEREWTPRFASDGLSLDQRRSGSYRAFVPERLANRVFRLDGQDAALVAAAERDIARLDTQARALGNTEALARLLLRAEAVASSRIEGLQVSPLRLLRAGLVQGDGEGSTDNTAVEGLANVDAMTYAVTGPESDVSVDRLLEVHRRLIAPTRDARLAGVLRDQQNWIGGTAWGRRIHSSDPIRLRLRQAATRSTVPRSKESIRQAPSSFSRANAAQQVRADAGPPRALDQASRRFREVNRVRS